MAKSENVYDNPNGELTIEEFIKIYKDGIDEYLSKFRISKMPCVPEKLQASNVSCFYCFECYHEACKRIKKTKKGYKIGNKTYKI